MTADTALAELARRYIRSHGPATVADLAWWSGLTITAAKKALELARGISAIEIDSHQYWQPSLEPVQPLPSPTVRLLPNYDEYTVSYTDRRVIYDDKHNDKLDARSSPLFQNVIIIDGQVAGTWRRLQTKSSLAVELKPFKKLTAAQTKAVRQEVERYRLFLDSPKVTLIL